MVYRKQTGGLPRPKTKLRYISIWWFVENKLEAFKIWMDFWKTWKTLFLETETFFFLEFRYRLAIARSLKKSTGVFTFIVIDWWGFSVSYYLHFREAFYKRLDVATGMMALLFIFPSILQDIGWMKQLKPKRAELDREVINAWRNKTLIGLSYIEDKTEIYYMVDIFLQQITILHKHMSINHSVTDATVLKEQIFFTIWRTFGPNA